MTKLQSEWEFWVDRKDDYSNFDDPKQYLDSLNSLGTFSTIEEFWTFIMLFSFS
jgi:hypothetical protein